jgi:hypothetical protein
MPNAEPESTAALMPRERHGITHKVEIRDETHGGTVEGYITGNLDRFEVLGEVFLHGFGKEGSTLDGWTQLAAILLSLGLQAGVDFEGLATRVGQMRFGDEQVAAAMRRVMAEWR